MDSCCLRGFDLSTEAPPPVTSRSNHYTRLSVRKRVLSGNGLQRTSQQVQRWQEVKRAAIQCKQRWQKMNDLVSKFCGAYAAATKQRTSGQNEADTVKLAHEIFYNDQKIKFNLHHAWEELRNDQKWCEVASSRRDVSGKKRKCDDGAQSESSQATSNLGDEPTNRPPGVKAAKRASGKRSIADSLSASEYQTM
ncbi:glutathione S-transferase T2-like [Brassica napus]|uniref:glutathione S-transferase T2-like n=1 Tax=Brassica napus TaxID=3708 RepID=UPI0020785A23|nr:glutathione S-transferase T2-like [Brassica napus]